MKKILGVVLTVGMVIAMTAVSFAVSVDDGFSTGGLTSIARTSDGNPAFVCRPKESVNGEGDYAIDTEHTAEYGAIVYLELLYSGGSWEDFALDMIRNIKLTTKWEQGAELVESVGVSILRRESKGDDRIEYFPALVIKFKDSTATARANLIGTITLDKHKGEKTYRIKDAEIAAQFEVNYYYNFSDYPAELRIDHDQQIIYPGEPHLLKFPSDCDDEVEFSFGGMSNEGRFTVDVSGQGKMVLLFDTVPNTAVEAVNPNADLIFFGFNGAKFNRTGEFFYETESGRYIYELVNGMPMSIAGAAYDEGEEGFRFITRTLGNYVISDIPLVAPDPEDAKAAELSVVARYNPVTRRYLVS